MAKAFNLLSKQMSTADKNKKTTKSKEVTKKKVEKKIAKPTKVKETNNQSKVVKRGRPPKVDKQVQEKKVTKTNSKVTNSKVTKSKVDKVVKVVKEPEVIKKPITTKTNNTNRRWHNLDSNPPEEFRPLEFNTNSKTPVFGYKVPHGIITNTPYYLDRYKKENNVIEWQYINGCINLSKCPKEFPDCTNCEIYQKRIKELKKNA